MARLLASRESFQSLLGIAMGAYIPHLERGHSNVLLSYL
jgi:hypothetical protein